jgi:hypothetical protein
MPNPKNDQPEFEDSIPPLPPPMPTLDELRKVHRESVHSKAKCKSKFNTPASKHKPTEEDNNQPATLGFATSTPIQEGGYFPEFFPSDADIPSQIFPMTNSNEPKTILQSTRKQSSQSYGTLSTNAIVVDDQALTSPSTIFWNKELALTDYDKQRLLSGDWLTDKHMNAVNKMLRNEFPMQNGLQDTLTLEECNTYASCSVDFVQIAHVCGNHWVCISNLHAPPGSGIVDVYDSIPSYSINSPSLKTQIAAIMKTGKSSFTIAFAVSLCMKLNPHALVYNQVEMRSLLNHWIDTGEMLPFHSTEKSRRMGRTMVLSKKVVPVFCICRLPWNKANGKLGSLVQCCTCKEWYHQVCCSIDSIVMDTPKYKYVCNKCLHV